MGAELIDKCKFAIAPSLGFRQHAFDERPRRLEFLGRERRRSRPPAARPGIGRQFVSLNVVRPVRPSNCSEPPGSDAQAECLDMASKPARGNVKLHQPKSVHRNNSPSFKVSGTFLKGDYLGVVSLRARSGSQAKRHAPRWRASQPKRMGVRVGPRYPRDSTMLPIATPRIVPMSEDTFARAVEILAEMLVDVVEA